MTTYIIPNSSIVQSLQGSYGPGLYVYSISINTDLFKIDETMSDLALEIVNSLVDSNIFISSHPEDELNRLSSILNIDPYIDDIVMFKSSKELDKVRSVYNDAIRYIQNTIYTHEQKIIVSVDSFSVIYEFSTNKLANEFTDKIRLHLYNKLSYESTNIELLD